jgi:hypothetical protein
VQNCVKLNTMENMSQVQCASPVSISQLQLA